MRSILTIFSLILVFSCKSDKRPSSAPSDNIDLDQQIKSSVEDMVLIPQGTLHMGGDNEQAQSNEYPKHEVVVSAFYMDIAEVTNAQYLEFVKATNYVTVAERPIIWEELKKALPKGTPKPPDSILQPGALVFTPPEVMVSLNDPSQWWLWTSGAHWRAPQGPGSSIDTLMDHPVVQVAWEDAVAYAQWAGKRLASEVEWEWAARGGLKNAIYPWGDDPIEKGTAKANFWQGLFPYKNTAKDGYQLTAPIKSYKPNGYGLYDMAGNVWEWCDDWYKVDHYQTKAQNETKGPLDGYNPSNRHEPHKVMRGGSFLCNDTYCSGYRNARRLGSSVDTGLNHTGFRCVKDVE